MKLNSKYFDRIRIRSRHPEDEPRPEVKMCEWEGCDQPGEYRAPKGNRAVGEYHNFCLEHVRHYNQVFNFFAGMKPDEMDAHLRREQDTDGRPSWGFGAKATAQTAGPRMPRGAARAGSAQRPIHDPFGVFARYARHQKRAPAEERVKPLHELDRRSFETLGFSGYAKSDDIKKAYKALVKIHHPDANGGDKSSEDRLRAIISAYSHLKAKGFVAK
jgi:DnaJ-domain-containing protein 1